MPLINNIPKLPITILHKPIITESQYKQYKHFAMVITNYDQDEANDLLQDCLMKLMRLNTPLHKYNNNYIFTSLKFMWIDKSNSNKYIDDEWSLDNLTESLTTDNEELIEIDNQQQHKLNIIVDVYERLSQTDKQLFYLHFTNNISARKIAKRVGLSHVMISEKINRIKKLIKEHYEKSKT